MAKTKEKGVETMDRLFPTWEVKDRIYVLRGKAAPVSFQLRSRHTQYRPLEYFDEDMKVPRPLRYVTNQSTVFADEQVDNFILGEVVFEDGELRVPGRNTILQKFLEIHPDNVINGGSRFEEFDPEKVAKKRVEEANKGFEAVAIAMSMDAFDLEAVCRITHPEKVDKLTPSEIKFEVMQWAQNNPERFHNIVNNSNIKMLNIVAKALKLGLIKIKDDNSTVVWGANGREIVTLGYSNNPKEALAAWLQSDDGLKVLESISEKLANYS